MSFKILIETIILILEYFKKIKNMKFLCLLLQETLVFASSSNHCELKCSWRVFNWDESIATVTSSGHSAANAEVRMAFDGDNEMDLNSANRASLQEFKLCLIAEVTQVHD